MACECCNVCTCPTCDACCSCAPWDSAFAPWQRTPTSPYTESYYREVYDDLLDLLPGCITRLYESKTECVDALVAKTLLQYPSLTEQEVRDAFQATWEEQDCQDYISRVGSTWHGWSVPRINGKVATPAALESRCPGGAPPSSNWCSEGQTRYWSIPELTFASGNPDIRKLVLATPGTGDWIVDAMLERGTQEDLPDEGWVEADDCASCDDPAVLESGCDSAADYKVFYDKTVTIRDSFTDLCDPATDEISLCPPENCKIVNIKVTRTNQCSPNSPASAAVTEWEVEIAVCPCAGAFVFSTPLNEDDEPLVTAAYGYASEQDCIDDLAGDNCLGGTPESQCISSQWQSVRHYVAGESRACLGFACSPTCSGEPECCT